jgi:hypothetical protein
MGAQRSIPGSHENVRACAVSVSIGFQEGADATVCNGKAIPVTGRGSP